MVHKRRTDRHYRERQERTGEPAPWLIDIAYGRGGKRWRHTVEGTLTRAQVAALERHYRARLEAGQDPLADDLAHGRGPAVKTWGELRKVYWQQAGQFLGWASRLEDHLERISAALGDDCPLGEVTTARVSEAVTRWRQEVAVLVTKRTRRVLGPNGPTTINTRLRVLARVLRWGQRVLGSGCAAIPEIDWPVLRLEEPDRQPLASYQAPETREAVSGEAAPHVRLALAIAEETGLRIASVLALRREHFDWGRQTYRVAVKSRKPGGRVLVLPITARLEELLTEAGARGGEGPVVTYRGLAVKRIAKGVRAARARAGAPGFTAKALRHTAAIEILAAGGDLVDAQRALGHADPGITQKHYGDVTADRVREALERRRRRQPEADLAKKAG